MSGHRIHWQPGVEEIVAREVAKALREAARDLNVDAVGFRPGWGSGNAEDLSARDALRQAVLWLCDRAAALADPEEKP